ncbi:MAG: DUF4469 domain-containing protein [Paludibacter sp.]|nr:DUF4469 domain-containing protein [Paludibacter sp.]
MKDPKHSLIVELYDLAISPGSNKRFGRVLTKRFLNEDDLVNIAVERRTDLNPVTLKAAINILHDIAEEELLNGASVNFGPGVFKLAVNGTFTSDTAEWSSDEHKIILQVSPTTRLYREMENIEVKVRGMAPVKTTINTVRDMATNKINDCLTRGNAVELKGVKLKIAGDSEANGITLTNTSTGAITTLPTGQLMANFPGNIIFILPQSMEEGDYQLELTTQYSNGSTLTKQPRTCRFNTLLRIN